MSRLVTVGVLVLGYILLDARLAAADDAVTDVNIVTAIDISDSVDPEMIRVEIDGLARAIRAPEVLEAIKTGRHGQIGFTVFVWYHAGIYPALVPWTTIGSATDANTVSNQIADCLRIADEAEGRRQSSMHHLGRLTDVSEAIDHAAELLAAAPYATNRKVVNIIGNGKDNVGEEPERARDRLIVQGGTINGVVLGSELSVLNYYRQQVAGGPGAFLLSANDVEKIVEFLVRKLRYDIVMYIPVAPR